MDYIINIKSSELCKNIQSFLNFINKKSWNYEQKDNVFQISFQSGIESKLVNKVHIITIQEHKLYSTTSLGIKVNPEAYVDTLKLINLINLEKIYYGRFVISKSNEIWYDLTLDLFDRSHDETIFNSLINISDGCAEKFGNDLFDVANGIKTFEEIVK